MADPVRTSFNAIRAKLGDAPLKGTFFGKTGNGKSATGTMLLAAAGSSKGFRHERRTTSVTNESSTAAV